MENPFKYLSPFTVRTLRTVDPDSAEFVKQIKLLRRDSNFESSLAESVIVEPISDDIEKIRPKVSDATRSMLFYINLIIIELLAATIIEIFFRSSDVLEYAKYVYAAAIVAILFEIYFRRRVDRLFAKCAAIILKDYTIPDEKRFTDNLALTLIRIRTTKQDIILPEELGEKIQCGCYSCKELYTSDKLKTVEGSSEYVCPHCGKTTIISERCGYTVNQELINDMHDYWVEE